MPRRTTRPTSEPTAQVTRLPRGARVGRYVVLNRIGAGGMGVVYAGYDPQLDRKVALKLLHHRGTDPDDLADRKARLLGQAQAMAGLQHPNVIRIHDVGTHGDRVFLAMELVEGETLKAWLHSERRWRDIVDVFVRAGRGLAAHAGGLVHGDFKPENVLIGLDGHVRVSDFAVARPSSTESLEEADARSGPHLSQMKSLTRTVSESGPLIGTPAYMAPEQFRCRIVSPETDQFAFCVSLYEGLFGSRPFHGATAAELADDVARGEVEFPTACRAPRWLRRLLTRGLGPAHARYPSMNALLADLGRRRGRLLRPAVAVGLPAAVAALGLWTQYADAQSQHEYCADPEARLTGVWDHDTKRAIEDAFDATDQPFSADVWRTIEPKLEDHANAWVDATKAACASDRGDSQPLASVQMVCLHGRRNQLDALTTVLAEADPTTVRGAVDAVYALDPIGPCADLEALSAAAVPNAAAADQARVDEVRAALARAQILTEAGNYAPASAVVRRAVATAREIADRPAQARAKIIEATLAERRGEVAKAEDAFHEALSAAIASDDVQTAARASIALARVVAAQPDRVDEAARWAQHARAMLERTGDIPGITAALQDLEGHLAHARGDYETAARLFAQAVSHEEAKDDAGHPGLGRALLNLGLIELDRGRHEAARQRLERALAVMERSYGPMHPDTAAVLGSLGDVLAVLGDVRGSRDAYDRALAIRRASLGPDHPMVAATHESLARSFDRGDDLERAQLHLRRAVDIRDRTARPDDRDLGTALSELGVIESRLGNHDVALQRHVRAVAIAHDTAGPQHPDYVRALMLQAESLLAADRLGGAAAGFERAGQALEAGFSGEHSLSVGIASGLGRAQLAAGDRAAAVVTLELALDLARRVDVAPLVVADARFALAQALPTQAGDRIRTEATAARDAYRAAGGRNRADEIDAWLLER